MLLFWGKLYCYSSTESKLLRVQLINYLFFLIRFLLQCLEDLDTSLRKLNSRLFVLRGQPTDLFPKIFKVLYPSCYFYGYCCWFCYSHKYVAVLSIILCASVIVTAVVIATGCYFSCCFCRECYTSTVVAASIVVSVYFVAVALVLDAAAIVVFVFFVVFYNFFACCQLLSLFGYCSCYYKFLCCCC